MEELSTILPLLQQFGITPDKLGPDRLNKLMEFSSKIKDPSSITPELSAQLMQTLGIEPNKPTKPRTSTRIGRNKPCPCKSGIKSKKCCFKCK